MVSLKVITHYVIEIWSASWKFVSPDICFSHTCSRMGTWEFFNFFKKEKTAHPVKIPAPSEHMASF